MGYPFVKGLVLAELLPRGVKPVMGEQLPGAELLGLRDWLWERCLGY